MAETRAFGWSDWLPILACGLVLVGGLLAILPLHAADNAVPPTPDPMQRLVRQKTAARLGVMGALLGGMALGALALTQRLLRGFQPGVTGAPSWGPGTVLLGAALVLVLPRLVLPEETDMMVGLGFETLCGATLVTLGLRRAGDGVALGLAPCPGPRLGLVLVPLLMLTVPLMMAGSMVTAVAYEVHGLHVMPQDVSQALSGAGGTWRLIPIVLYILLAAPLFEELLYRGLVFGLLRRFGAGWAVGGSALVFALVHDPVAIAPTFGAGLVLALLRERSGTLAAPLALHAASNLTWTLVGVLTKGS